MAPWTPALFLLLSALLSAAAPAPEPTPSVAVRLERHRNLGKAFYENPTTQKEAVEEFRKALTLAPASPRERLNYGLALLRAGRTAEGAAELEAVQKADPSLPHTWFNLGILHKRAGEAAKAIGQMERFVKLVPDDPIGHYNLGALYKMEGRTADAEAQFRKASELDPGLAAARFQLYNSYRSTGRTTEAREQLQIFQRLKKEQEGAAIPEDVEWNFWAEVLDVMHDVPQTIPGQPLVFASRPLGGPAEGAVLLTGTGLTPPRILLWTRSGLRLHPAGPMPQLSGVTAVAPGDFNNDGLPDLAVLTEAGPVLLAARGAGFVRVEAGLPRQPFRAAVWMDYDHDYDLDLFLLGDKSLLFRNAGEAGFQDRTSGFPFTPGKALSAETLRVEADTKAFDLLVGYEDRPAVLYRDKLMGTYRPEATKMPSGAAQLQAVDTNNDGYPDVAFLSGGAVHILPNRGGRFGDPHRTAARGDSYVLADLGNRGVLDLAAGTGIFRATPEGFSAASQSLPDDCRPAAAADLDHDGRTDIVCAGPAARILKNTSARTGNYLRVALEGVRNLKLAPGAEIEVKAGRRYQKKLYSGVPLTFGIGMEKAADTIRISWPNGLIQNEIRKPAGQAYELKEAQRLSGSCPIIWTWDGEKFRYITDVLGVAPLGASSGEGSTFAVDHDEYIQIPGEALRARDGQLEVRITEELAEVAYLDQIRLFAVDHPEGSQVFTNDKFKAPPFPDFRLFRVDRPVSPVSARDHRGRDVLGRVLRLDRSYPDGFRRDLAGRAELHHLDLDFGNAAADGKAILVLSGWVDWADGSTFLGAAQESAQGLVMPYLQVRDAAGEWRTVIGDMGLPAGKPKTIVVDLTGKWLSESREVRIVSSLCVYWDRIFLSESTGSENVFRTEASLKSADLHFRGFSPVRVHPQRLQPEEFSYETPAPSSSWNPTPGMYTRFGDVADLARSIDDRLVVMGSGDELVLKFRDLPAPRPGYRRDYLLMVDGWAKDSDANTSLSQTTWPLPFHGMETYPYPAKSRGPATDGWEEEYLTRPALRPLRPLRVARQADAVSAR